MFLLTQYYRPPFPNRRYWNDDFSRIRDAGLNGVQLWCIWGWIEHEPGRFDYADYDELVDLAAQKGLKVVLSAIAEIHPFWIHRLVPDSAMVNHLGQVVTSSCRNEVNVGLTPGGCFDNPRVAELMGNFLTDIAAHYAGATNVIGWDCWNETRWCVHSDGHVCYCDHTLREFRHWLDARHGGLAGVNAAWQRRYTSWDDVMPGKHSPRPFTDLMEFQRFLSWRAAMHTKFRYEAIRRGDGRRIISAHCGTPAIQSIGFATEQALCRGNDWDLADQLDGFGCSHFPYWFTFDEAGFGVRVEQARGANRGKTMWVSELQGGSSRGGAFMAMSSVPAAPQQRWIASSMARGAKGVIFWCWRDEVFGRESSGFGLAGWDGLADQRLAAMAGMGEFIGKHNTLIENYRPDEARVGVLFVPDNYYLEYADHGKASAASDGVNACATALERLRLPYDIVEAYHLDALDHLDVLLMPWCPVLPAPTRKALEKFIRRGGVVLIEAETDSFDELGFYRYPDERPFMQALGLHDLGRRALGDDKTLIARLGDEDVELVLDAMTTPLKVPPQAEVLATDATGQPLLVRRPLGKGSAFVLGSFLGSPYQQQRNDGLEKLIAHVAAAGGVRAAFDVDAGDGNELLLWRSGASGRKRLLWIINGGEDRKVTVNADAGKFGRAAAATLLRGGERVSIRNLDGKRQLTLSIAAGEWTVLSW